MTLHTIVVIKLWKLGDPFQGDLQEREIYRNVSVRGSERRLRLQIAETRTVRINESFYTVAVEIPDIYNLFIYLMRGAVVVITLL